MRGLLIFLGWLLVCAVLGLLVLYAFVVDVWRIPEDDPLLAASIEPTLRAGDLVVLLRRSSVTRGILVRCEDPDAPGRFVVARAIARGGDRIELRNDRVSLDGRPLKQSRDCAKAQASVYNPRTASDVSLACSLEDYGDFPFSTLRSLAPSEPPVVVTIEASRWFLVSDNRHVHLDSRDYGPIDPRTCQHIVFRLAGASGVGDAERRLGPIW
jgi:signal peptidase I